MAQPGKYKNESPSAERRAVAVKRERLEVRLTVEQKRLALRAAALRGCTVTDFIRQAVQDSALQAVTEYEVMVLCVEDQEAFAAALLSPPEPGPRLRTAYGSYKERIGR